jgi:hypothetical protein
MSPFSSPKLWLGREDCEEAIGLVFRGQGLQSGAKDRAKSAKPSLTLAS